MIAVIMAGGKGTRISSITTEIPKPMIPICGKPVLEREIECLKDNGITELIITIGHLGDSIRKYFGDGIKWGMNISYYYENEPLGNAGAIFRIVNDICDDDDSFLLLNADSIFEIDFTKLIGFHRDRNADVTLFTHPNSHPYDSGLIITDESCRVFSWLSKEDDRPVWYKNRVNAGLHVIKKNVIERYLDTLSGEELEVDEHAGVDGKTRAVVPCGKVDLDRMILKPLTTSGNMYAYDSPEYVKDMGTPDRYYAVCEDYKNGIVSGKNLTKKQKAVFLDRDGTINKYCGFLKNIEDFELLDGVSEAIKRINASGYLAIVVTNQPVIARGEVTQKELYEIHCKMETLLGQDGAYLDAIYYCPHHPDKGFEGERVEYKIQCDCRKPKPGMLLKAAEDYNIDLAESWMIGDSDSDVLVGINAGCRTARICTDESSDNRVEADIDSISLVEAVKKIVG